MKKEKRRQNVKIGVIIPVYNEEKIIEDTIEKIRSFNAENDSYSFWLVNDGSRDNTRKIIEESIKAEERIFLISYDENKGKGGAVREGMINADGDALIFTDADLAYGLDTVKEMGDRFSSTESELIIGNRHAEGGFGKSYGFVRKLASVIYLKIISLFFGMRISDSQCGIKGYRQPYAKKIFENCETRGFAFDFETVMIAKKMGLAIEEMPVTIKKNNEDSKVHIVRDSLRMIRDLVRIKKRIKKIKID